MYCDTEVIKTLTSMEALGSLSTHLFKSVHPAITEPAVANCWQ